jgi:chromosomal replication initiation ATPase DnaA
VSGRRPPGRQLPLRLPFEPALGRDDFIVGPSNRVAAEAIDRWPAWPSPVVLLVGPAGSGKSHLVAVWAARAGARVVDGGALAGSDPVAIAAAGAVAVEDADRAPGSDVALFHLLNAARAVNAAVLLTARAGPEAWPPVVPDLASRLRGATRLDMAEPDDTLLVGVLAKLFSDRQLPVDLAVIEYLVTRMERSLAAANAIVAAIDGEALATRRPVTRPLAAQILDRLSAGDADG